MRMRFRYLMGLAIGAALVAPPAMAQTTGQIVGTVIDAQGGVLPGVTVTATSPQLQGARTSVTDGAGQFRFPSVPPGTYAIKAELSGFQPATQENVRVSLDQTVTLNLKLQVGGITQQVDVQGTAPVVDTTTAGGGVTVDQKMMTLLPVARDMYATARFAPGVTTDTVGPTALGSTGAENQYLIEGLNTTGIQAGEKAKTMLVDFIDEVNVKTEGANAEYGRFTGGMIEAITKSGGNAFHGQLYGFGAGGPLQSGESTASRRPQTTTTVVNTAHQWDVGATLGGYVVKDRLWFFGAYNPLRQRDETNVIRTIASTPGTPGIGEIVPATITRNLYSGKATFNAASSQTLVFSIMRDPEKREGNVFHINGPPST